MNPEEARLILQCRRPQGQDDALPAMAEAWRTLEHLPGERTALEADAALDALIGQKLRRFAPPDDLLCSILAGAHVTPRLPWWRRRGFLPGAAALIAVSLSSLLLKPSFQPAGNEIVQTGTGVSLTDFREDTTAKVNEGGVRLSHVSPRFPELQAYLASHSKSQPVSIPEALAPLPTHGCEVFMWKGREVTLVCFETEAAGIAHLFTINASDLPMDSAEPLSARVNGWETLTWKQDGKIMQLIARTTPEHLRRLARHG